MWTSFTFCGIDLHIGRRRRQLWSWLCQIGWDLRCLHCWVSQNSNACIHGASPTNGSVAKLQQVVPASRCRKSSSIPKSHKQRTPNVAKPFHGSWMLMAYQGLSTLPVHLCKFHWSTNSGCKCYLAILKSWKETNWMHGLVMSFDVFIVTCLHPRNSKMIKVQHGWKAIDRENMWELSKHDVGHFEPRVGPNLNKIAGRGQISCHSLLQCQLRCPQMGTEFVATFWSCPSKARPSGSNKKCLSCKYIRLLQVQHAIINSSYKDEVSKHTGHH